LDGAHAEGWDDFSNNLATDLSPLLALFGEQVTKQFLSESLSPLDNFIFAMAPLGILTAVVSAIRVCGSSSLRAFIGRAQEGSGTVEAELCSSTSRSVSELYNNGGIARVFGRPKVLEVVRDPNSNDFYDDPKTGREFNAGIFTFKDYRSTERGAEEWTERASGIRRLFSQRTNTAQEKTVASEDSGSLTHNPNLSLNIGIKRQPDWVFMTAALIGFFIQTAVLVFGAVITYQLRWERDGRIPDRWAFPLSFSGTLLQCTGMFLCARLVEQSTKERRFHRRLKAFNSQSPCLSSLHWLQPGNQAVGDQIFDAFAYNDSDKPLREYISSSKVQGSDPIFLVWVAISVTMGGFILQFVGLRAMHSSVAVFQLGAMLVMSVIRAGLRARRFETDENDLRDIIEIVQGHELDWQGLQFEANNSKNGVGERYWLVSNSPVNKENGSKTQGSAVFIENMDGSKTLIGFKSRLGEDEVKVISEEQKHERESTRTQPTVQQDEWQPSRPCLAVRLLKYRARLARLTNTGPLVSDLSAWEDKHVYVRQCARRLRMVIEETAEILFSDVAHLNEDWRDVSSMFWALEVVSGSRDAGQSRTDLVFISIRRERDSNGWRADASELEAVLGLWIWSWKRAYPQYLPGKANHFRRVVAEYEQEHGSGSNNIDFAIWMEGLKRRPQRETFEGKEGAPPLFGLKSARAGARHVLTVPADNCLAIASAQDIFMSFLSAAASITHDFGGITSPKMGTQDFYLHNDKLSKLVQLFHDNHLGSREDAYLSIVPVLQARSRLPSVSQCLDTARLSASDARRRGDWDKAEDLLQWAWRSSEAFDDQQRSALALGEFYRWAILDEGDKNQGRFDPSRWIVECAGKHPTIVEIFKRYEEVFQMIHDQDRLQVSILHAASQNMLVDTLALLRPGASTSQVDERGRTPLHWAAIRGWVEVVVGLLEIGAEPDFGDNIQRTALSYASEGGHLEVVQVLVSAGAFPNKEDREHRTPLSYAAAKGHNSVVELLIRDARVACDTTDNRGQSPLHWAARGDSVPVVVKLLQASRTKQQFIDAARNDGLTSLIVALMNGKTNVASLLLDEGASCAIRIKEKPAWQWLIEQGDTKSAELLLKELNKALAAKDPFSKNALRNSAELYIFSRALTKVNHDIIANLDRNKGQPQKLLEITFLDRRGKPITTMSMKKAARGVYQVLAVFAEVEGQQVKITRSTLLQYGTMGIILSRNPEVKVTEDVVKIAAGNKQSGEEILSLLLDRRQEEVRVTEEVVKAAAENEISGREILSLLLDGRAQVLMTEGLTAAIAGYANAIHITQLLERRLEVKVTETVVRAVAGNRWSGAEVMALLLDGRAEEVRVTEEVLKAAAGNGGDGVRMMSLFLDRRPEEVRVTEEVIKAAAGNEGLGAEVLSLLLDRRAEEVRVTEEVVKAAAGNEGLGAKVLSLLLDRRPEEVKVTEEVIKAAAGNEGCGADIMALLLDRRAEEVKVTDEVMKAVAGNEKEGIRLMFVLLNRRPEEVKVTEYLIKAVAGNMYGAEAMSFLLDRRPEEVRVTEEVVKAAAGNGDDGDRMMSLFLDRRPEEVRVTEEVIKAAAGNEGLGAEVLSLLLDRRAEEVRVTEDVIKAAAGNERFGAEVLSLLLDRRPEEVRVTEDVIKAAAGNERFGAEVMGLLLDFKPEEVKVTGEVIKAAAGNKWSGPEVMSLLLDYRPEQVKVTEEVVKAAPQAR
jgi:ankyrin repeat protein